MAKVLLLKNIPRESAGLLERVLLVRRIKYDIIELTDTVTLPALDEYKAVIVLGGPDSANDTTKKMQRELKFVQEILQRKIPFLGICLGLQVMVKAAGGQVIASPHKEIGFVAPDNTEYNITLTPQGRSDPLFEGLSNTFRVFQLHGETVLPTKETHTLGTGVFCKEQVVKYHQAYGLQCHFELTKELFELWLHEDPDLQKLDASALRYQFESIAEEYTNTGILLFHNFFDIAGL